MHCLLFLRFNLVIEILVFSRETGGLDFVRGDSGFNLVIEILVFSSQGALSGQGLNMLVSIS